MSMEPSDTHGYWDWERDTLMQAPAHSSLLHTMHTGIMVKADQEWVIGNHSDWDEIPNQFT